MDNVFLLPEHYTDIELHAGQHGRFGQNLIYTSLAKTSYGELIEGYLSEGQTLTVMPANQYDSMIDVFFFIDGDITAHVGATSRLLRPQTLLSSDKIDLPLKLEAQSKARYLHFQAPPWMKPNPNEGKKGKANNLGFEFLFSRGSIELMFGTLDEGRTMHAIPEGEGAVEVYYIIDGLLSLESRANSAILKSGDYFVARDHIRTQACFANTKVNFLYFSNLAKNNGIEIFHNELINLASEVEQKDGYTADHCHRLQRLSVRTAKALGLGSDEIFRLGLGALLHDLGKVKVPLEILNKPGKLNNEEWAVIKEHPLQGSKMLANTELEIAATIVAQHHERLDGSGYPFKLKGNEILTESYIVAVADTFDAMTTDRSYRKALSTEVALAEIKALADKKIPKEIIDAFIKANGDE
ncbi:MAG: HD-GYP domain-containing protein [Trueperaceae bacterium]|nr:HD-GYP domain-containing protein [Trueperaceae bacterium]